MLLVAEIEPGEYELLYMWLPTWLGVNINMKRRVERHLEEKFVGKEASEQELHEAVIDFLCAEFPAISGLRAFLSAVSYVSVPDAHG